MKGLDREVGIDHTDHDLSVNGPHVISLVCNGRATIPRYQVCV